MIHISINILNCGQLLNLALMMLVCLYSNNRGVAQMFKTVGIYKNIKDPNAFEEYYQTKVFPIILSLPGVINIRVSTLIPTGQMDPNDDSVKILFETYYESAEALEQLMSSEAGKDVIQLILGHDLAEFESYIGIETFFEK